MLVLRASHAQLDQLRLHAVELRFGLRDIQIRRYAAVEAVARQRQVFLVGSLRARKQSRFGVGAAQAEIILRELGLVQQPGVFEVGLRGLRRGGGGGDAAPDAAPQIGFPTRADRQIEQLRVPAPPETPPDTTLEVPAAPPEPSR